jgi:uncharacterized protein YxjI
MKRKCAVFTMARNERVFLPIWLNYYSKFFPQEDIFVLDHLTDDGSTENLKCNVLRLDYELAYDEEWRVTTFQNKVKELLSSYECVICTDTDELLFSPNLPLDKLIDEFLLTDQFFLTCTGYEIMQNEQLETAFNVNGGLLKQRSFWFRNGGMDKSLITKIPLYWELGFHNVFAPTNVKNYAYDLICLHLHRFDWQLMLERHLEHFSWKQKERHGISWHYLLNQEADIRAVFESPINHLVAIPENIKETLLKIGL